MTRHTQPSSRRAKRWRSTIPKDIYDSVLGIAVDIVNATLRDDDSSARAHYRRLKRYCGAQEAKGRLHPFLPETLADFASSKHTAIKLYHRALRLSRRAGEQQHTILLSLSAGFTSTRATGARHAAASTKRMPMRFATTHLSPLLRQ